MKEAAPLITSRSNPLVTRLRKLGRTGAGYRRGGEAMLEGEHLCAAWVGRGRPAATMAVLAETHSRDPGLRALAATAAATVVISDEVMAGLGTLESAPAIVFVVDVPSASTPLPHMSTVVLDAVQDPGNVGTIVRSAAAFGFAQVIALEGTAGLWSAKVVRAGMGAHFGLHLVEGIDGAALGALGVPLYGTSPHARERVDSTVLDWPCAWVLGHEGRGLAPAMQARCTRVLCIPQPGGEESLNVAAAASVCLYESARQRLAAVPLEAQ